MKIYVRPVFRESIQGRNHFNIVDGVKVGTTKAPNGTFMFQPQLGKDGKLAFNLGRLVENKWYKEKEEDVTLPSSWKDSTIWKKQKITRQEELELKYNKPQGFLSTEAFVIGNDGNIKNKKRTYLQTLSKIFKDSLNELNLDNMDEELIYEAILESKFFANSIDEINSTPYSRFYISHIEEEEEQKASRNKKKITAAALLNELMDKHETKLHKVAVVLKIVQGRPSTDIIKNKLFDYINETNNGALKLEERIDKFIEVGKQATSKNKVDQDVFNTHFLGQDLINYRVVNDFKGRYTWVAKQGTSLEELGKSWNEYIAFLSDMNTQHYVEELRNELDTRI